MFDGVAEVDALATYAVFATARRRGFEVDPHLVTADGATEVVGCYGTTFGGLVPWSPETARVLAGIDSGALFLGAAGLIGGRPTTTHRQDLDRLKEWTEVVDARIVDDGDLVTCGSGWFAGTDLAYWLLERELGSPADIIALEQWTGRDRQGTIWRRGLS